MVQKWLPVRQACETLGIPRSTLYRHIKEGKIKSRKDENDAILCLIEVPNASQIETAEKDELIALLRSEVEYLRQQLQNYEMRSERQDTIVLQLTRQLEQSQRLLEFHQEPWYRRWFGKRYRGEQN